MNLNRKQLAFVVGGVAAVFNSSSLAFFATYQPSDGHATLAVALVGAINVALTTAAGYLKSTD